jgi:hypothetical protein
MAIRKNSIAVILSDSEGSVFSDAAAQCRFFGYASE